MTYAPLPADEPTPVDTAGADPDGIDTTTSQDPTWVPDGSVA